LFCVNLNRTSVESEQRPCVLQGGSSLGIISYCDGINNSSFSPRPTVVPHWRAPWVVVVAAGTGCDDRDSRTCSAAGEHDEHVRRLRGSGGHGGRRVVAPLRAFVRSPIRVRPGSVSVAARPAHSPVGVAWPRGQGWHGRSAAREGRGSRAML
jgi:hypothetical protein